MQFINEILQQKRTEAWRRKDYRTSIDYYYAKKLAKYNFDPMNLTIWYIDKENKYMQFGANEYYYELRDGKINKVSSDYIWIDRIRYDKKKTTKES